MKIDDISICKEMDESPIRWRHAMLKPTDISPLNAYYALKDLFGPPNADFDETKSQWAYCLQTPNAQLDIYDWKLYGWSIAVHIDASKVVSDELLRLKTTGATRAEVGKRFVTAQPFWAKKRYSSGQC
jgi:hypothetical protein